MDWLITDSNESTFHASLGDPTIEPYPELRAYVKFDGCTHIWVTNLDSDPDYVHVDDLGAFIQALQALKSLADQRFPQPA